MAFDSLFETERKYQEELHGKVTCGVTRARNDSTKCNAKRERWVLFSNIDVLFRRGLMH